MLAQAINRRFAFFCNTSEYGNYWGITDIFSIQKRFCFKGEIQNNKYKEGESV